MSERPIIFSGEMVRAILEGRKTQTRRVIKPQPIGKVENWDCLDPRHASKKGSVVIYHGNLHKIIDAGVMQGYRLAYYKCPYGLVGDRLWVRETWSIHQLENSAGKEFPNILYKADSSTLLFIDKRVWKYNNKKFSWRPSIHMPRWASRITLEITDVRVERVQEISHEDALSEGINPNAPLNDYGTGSIYRDIFAELWDSLNSKRGYGWDKNPWVWVIKFKKVEDENHNRDDRE